MTANSVLSILTLVLISLGIVPIFGYHHKKTSDGLCPEIRTVLCFKDVVNNIANNAKDINNVAHQIKQQIRKESSHLDLDGYIAHKMDSLRDFLPQSKYHHQFKSVQNNINRTDLLNLLKEQNFAYTYLYNSIKSVLKLENIFAPSIDKSFKTILYNIQKNILCNYRNIFYTYSEFVSSVDDISGIPIANRRKRHAPSVMHNSYSMIIVELLNEWMKHVESFVKNLETKLLR
ncbi:hypothetical protein I4U23_025054 [Adineta vaga]|nr:hypothetical protein I4U23_025054 [Adineta vaga]